MSERHRALPPWMAKKEQKKKEKEPLKSRRKMKTARAVFYCMNEKELVEAAVSCLSRCEDAMSLLTDRKVEDEAADLNVKTSEDPASSTAKQVPSEEEGDHCGDAQDMTYVSETDLDNTEVEMEPYAKSLQSRGHEGQRSGPDQDHGGPMKAEPEAERKEERFHMSAEAAAAGDDDALRLVREIFFT